MRSTGRRFFFVHVMKTGGATFRQHVYANFRPGEVYPSKRFDGDMHQANTRIDYLLSLPPERRARIRAYTGHFPYVVTELMGEPFVTLTILRDPVDRTISYLKHCKRYHDQHRDLALEEIYEDPFFFPCFIHNHQTKVFSMHAGDPLESLMDVIEIDDARLALAQERLEAIDVLGITDQHAAFLATLESKFGWHFDDRPDRRVGEAEWTVPASLRRRIADDNGYDAELYAYARRLWERRAREGR